MIYVKLFNSSLQWRLNFPLECVQSHHDGIKPNYTEVTLNTVFFSHPQMRTRLTAAYRTAWKATFLQLHGRFQFHLLNPATGMDVVNTAQTTSSGRPPSHKRTSGVGHKQLDDVISTVHLPTDPPQQRCCSISKYCLDYLDRAIPNLKKEKCCPLQDVNENWLILDGFVLMRFRSFTCTSCGLKLQLVVVCILEPLDIPHLQWTNLDTTQAI